ncbi:MAG: HEAT repeat domain-containing protein [Myxococcaceae bacterium]|nr:HEAT repeat domain-containing protein [Myxococcaceae bacterium]
MSARGIVLILSLWLAACPGGRDKWLAQLQSPRPDERAIAVKKLAERFDADDLPLFTQAARDPVGMVRAEAMAALGKSADPRVVDLLGEALGDPDEDVQAAAARSLAVIRNDKARGYLTLQYSRRGRSTRLVIVEGLKSANVPGAMASCVAAEANSIWEQNLKVLQEGALPERVGAAEELGRSGRPEAVNRLVPLLKDKQVVLAAAAARGLGSARDMRAVPALSALLDENFPELREAACEALFRLKDPSSLPKLAVVALEGSPTSPLATRAIAELPVTAETNKALCDVVMSGGGVEVEAAGRAMRQRGGCPMEPLLEKLKTSPNTGLRALTALGPMVKEHAAKVAPLLTSNEPLTRRLAVDTLAELQDPSSAGAVLKAFDAELKAIEPLRADWIPAELQLKYSPGFNPDEAPPERDVFNRVSRARTSEMLRRVQALDAQRLKERGKVPLTARPPRELVDDGTEEQYQIMGALLRAMGRLKVDGARARIEPFTEEQSPTLRAAAFAGLALLGPETVPLVKPALLDAERSVQGAVAQVLAETSPEGRAAVLEVLSQLVGDRSRLVEPLKGQPLPPGAAPVLLALVKEGGADGSTAAAILAEMQAPESASTIAQLLKQDTVVGRRELIAALGRVKSNEAVVALGRELFSDSPAVRAAAADALALQGDAAKSQLESLDALKGDYAVRVREAANQAVSKLSPSEGQR